MGYDPPIHIALTRLFEFGTYVVYYDNLTDDTILELIKGLKHEAGRRNLKVPEFEAPTKVFSVPDLTVNEQALVESGRMITAIKELRARLGCGLKDAKDAADAYRDAWKAAGSPVGGIPKATGNW